MHRLICLAAMLLGTVIAAAAADATYRHVVKKSIPEIQSLEWGTNVSPEGLANGFTHCFFVTFKDKAALERYLPHPEHKKFGAQLKGLLDKVLVVDYVAR